MRAQEIRHWVRELDVEQIAIARPRSRVRVAGVVDSIKVIPLASTTNMEVQIYDGTDIVTAVWLGRKRIEGVDLGAGVILDGMMGRFHGELQMINPSYTLLPAQDSAPR